MTEGAPGAGAARRGTERPWWVPLLGVGSVGLGGLMVLAGLAACGIGLFGPDAARRTVLLSAAAWLLPGGMLAVAGVGVVLGRRWGRTLSLAAVAAGMLALGLVWTGRKAIPPAVADTVEWGLRNPECPPWVRKVWDDSWRGQEVGPFDLLRDPSYRDEASLGFAVDCCVPVLPWYFVVLFACAPPWGVGIVRPGVSGTRTGAGGAS